MSRAAAPSLAPGTIVEGFRIVEPIGTGSRGTVYAAEQLGLGRAVALRLLAPGLEADPGFRARFLAQRWPEHRAIVPMYTAGRSDHGLFVAGRLMRGRTLAGARLRRAQKLAALTDVAEALDAAHAEGISHSAVSAHNVFLDDDGHALVADFGLAPEGATPAADRAAFAALIGELLGEPPAVAEAATAGVLLRGEAGAPAALAGGVSAPNTARSTRWRSPGVAIAGALLAAAVVAAFVVLREDDERGGGAPVPRGAVSLGSSLSADGTTAVDCAGERPTGSSPGCTVLQTRLPGRRLRAARDGAVRRWSVRGTRGTVALQVLRRRGPGYVVATRSQDERVPDAGVHSFAVDLTIRRGDLVALEVAPGGEIGVREGSGGATTARWLHALGYDARRPTHGPDTGFDHELLLRVDYLPGARRALPAQLTGAAAAAAAPGRELDEVQVERGGRAARLVLVRLGDGIALDLFRGGRRVARRSVPDADPRGEPVRFEGRRLDWPGPHLEWRNPGGRTVVHNYLPGLRSIRPLD